ncbi:MAG: peptidase dimerization domain-containing protein [Candidatus Omnitrophica bacterium]|nr:peptidase dimerization domain-containing protein [Candidatus Omnitrophota bacterium]
MYARAKEKIAGLHDQLSRFSKKISDFNLDKDSVARFSEHIVAQMKALSFDAICKDKAGNIIGIIKGYDSKKGMAIISHMDITPQISGENDFASNFIRYKAGIISSIFAAASLKRSLVPLEGDLIVCCVPRSECCDLSIKYLFDNFLKSKLKKIKGIILSEPTGFNLHLGHKGRMEYEIVVRGRLGREFMEHKGINMLGAMFPLIHELENVSRNMPSDYALGTSSLRIKDVRYAGAQPCETASEFRVIVDRVFIPQENENLILNKAKTIAKNIYKNEAEVSVNTTLTKERVKTYTGLELVSEKEFKPWIMEGSNPFVMHSLEALRGCGFDSSVGYWKKIVTEGSYTFGERGIPTIGFGAGSEEEMSSGLQSMSTQAIEKAVYGLTMIVQRTIGIPSFGWSDDEI